MHIKSIGDPVIERIHNLMRDPSTRLAVLERMKERIALARADTIKKLQEFEGGELDLDDARDFAGELLKRMTVLAGMLPSKIANKAYEGSVRIEEFETQGSIFAELLKRLDSVENVYSDHLKESYRSLTKADYDTPQVSVETGETQRLGYCLSHLNPEATLWRTLDSNFQTKIARGEQLTEPKEIETRRRSVISSSRRVAEVFANGGEESSREVISILASCLDKMPLDDFLIYNGKHYRGHLMATGYEKNLSLQFQIQALVLLHDFMINQLERGAVWSRYIKIRQQQIEEERVKRIERRRLAVKRYKKLIWKCFLWQSIIAGLLIGAIVMEPPRSYYVMLRFACCSAFGFWAWEAHTMKNEMWRNTFALAAIAYNPFMPIMMERGWWIWINLATIGLAIGSTVMFMSSEQQKDHGEA